jgi:hypothetical protein
MDMWFTDRFGNPANRLRQYHYLTDISKVHLPHKALPVL